MVPNPNEKSSKFLKRYDDQRAEWKQMIEKIALKKGGRSTKLLMSKKRIIQEHVKKVERDGIEKLFQKKYNWVEPWDKTLRKQFDPLDDLAKFTEDMKDVEEDKIDKMLQPDTYAVQVGNGHNGLVMRIPQKKTVLDKVVVI